jgi:hypothetical protein
MRKYARYLRNLSLLVAALTVSLTLIGVSYAHWTESLHIDGYAQWSNFYIELTEQETNDPLDHWFDYHDPPVQGADENIAPGFSGNPYRIWKDVGMTHCDLVDTTGDGLRDTCLFYIYNAYPCYFGKLTMRVTNQSTDAWVYLDSVDVISSDDPSSPEYPYNYSSPDIILPPWPHPPGFEVQWTNGAWNLPIKIPPGQSTYLGCEVHVLQLPDNQDETYDFQIKFNFSGPYSS